VTTAKAIRRQGSARGQGWLVVAHIGWSFTVGRGPGWRALADGPGLHRNLR
jgi:hypothetical protein